MKRRVKAMVSFFLSLSLVVAEMMKLCDLREESGTALADQLRSRSDCEDCSLVLSSPPLLIDGAETVVHLRHALFRQMVVSAAGDFREVAALVEAVVADGGDGGEHCSLLFTLALVVAEMMKLCDLREESGTALADRLRSRSDCEDCSMVH